MLGMGIAASGGSHFRHVEVLPPGHYIVANRDSIASHQYWDFNFPREEELIVLTDQEYAEQFRSLLDESAAALTNTCFTFASSGISAFATG